MYRSVVRVSKLLLNGDTLARQLKRMRVPESVSMNTFVDPCLAIMEEKVLQLETENACLLEELQEEREQRTMVEAQLRQLVCVHNMKGDRFTDNGV